MKKILAFFVAIIVAIGIVAILTINKGHDLLPHLTDYAQTTSPHALIEVTQPESGETIDSPLHIEGKARGMWFFEGSFPVSLEDEDGVSIAQGIATAQGEWMTEDFVPFTADLTFTSPDNGGWGTLVLKKDNPSGLPEHDDELEVTVAYKKQIDTTKTTITLDPNAKVFDITAVNYNFSPSQITVQKGDTVTINFESTDGLHGFVLEEFGISIDGVAPGEPTSVTFSADTVGTFEFHCPVGEHADNDMVGQVIVTE